MDDLPWLAAATGSEMLLLVDACTGRKGRVINKLSIGVEEGDQKRGFSRAYLQCKQQGLHQTSKVSTSAVLRMLENEWASLKKQKPHLAVRGQQKLHRAFPELKPAYEPVLQPSKASDVFEMTEGFLPRQIESMLRIPSEQHYRELLPSMAFRIPVWILSQQLLCF